DTGPVPQVVVDAAGLLALANQQARTQFNLAVTDLGRPFHELELSARPADLRAAIGQAAADGRPVSLREVAWQKAPDETEYLDVQVVPMRDHANGGSLGVSVTFSSVTQFKRLQEELRRSNAELESAYEELQS